MMVEHQPQECSPVKNMTTGDVAADKPTSNGSSQPGASGDDDGSAGADHGAAATAKSPTAAPSTAISSEGATRTYPTPPVAKEALLYAPLLVGKYYIEDKRAVWSGKWGMTEAAFGENGITSPFEMRSQEDVFIPTAAAGGAEAVNPSFFGVALARSSRTENDLPTQVSPMYLGYETNPDVRSAMPFHSKYSGFFQIQAVKGKPQTVMEKDVDIRFVHDASNPSFFAVTGSGENRFGVFTLHGFLDKTTNELRIYKIYKPKQPEKRALPRRARNTKAVTPPAAPKPPVATVALPPVSVPAVSSVRPTITQTPVPVASTHTAVAAPRPVSTPMSDYSSPSVGGRARTVRKPARLRDENVIELDRVPANVKKCHAILKSLMSSSKATPFLAPVDPVALGIPDYFQVIKEPMDLGTIKQNVECGYYDEPSVFADHVRLVFRNAMLYNAAHSQVHIYAQKLLEEFEKRIKTLNLKMSAKEKTIQSKHAAIKVKKERKAESSHHSSKKVKGGKGSKGNTKRRAGSDETGLIMSLKEDIERLKATLEQLQPSIKVSTPKPSKAASRPFKMSDLTEEELNEPMTQQEKARLSTDIKSLPQDKINRVLQIIAEAVPVAKLANENDEIELDINAFDTRCLRMLEGYVRENGIGRKRKRPVPKKSRATPTENRLKSAKVAALNIRYRQEELKSQLAAIDRDVTAVAAAAVGEKRADPDVTMTDVDGSVDASGEAEAKADDGVASDSSSSSSDSSDSDDSDSDSDSESDDDSGAPLERSPSLANAPALSQIESARAEAARKIRDEVASSEPLKVVNRGAWSMLAKQDAPPGGKSLIRSEDNESSSLWLSARSMEQQKQQKMQQKEHELEAQRRRDAELREKEREREEADRRKQEQELAAQQAEQARLQEERSKEAERERAARRAAQREKVLVPEEELEHHDHTLSEDLETFSSSSFL